MSIKAKPSFSLKDQLFNENTVGKLSARLAAGERGFRKGAFEREVLARFPELELKERIDWIVTTLERHLPGDFLDAKNALLRALPEPLDPNQTDDDFGSFIWIVPGEYVAKHGCSETYRDESLGFLREATKRFSSESAIRPFLKRFPAETMAFVRECAVDENYHVRRLASEGIRPFLPWAVRADLPVDAIIEVLDQLYADQTRYVTRSVANTLNDISKFDANAVVDSLRRWRKAGRQGAAELNWMTRHALRSLLKEDNAAALDLLGYAAKPKFRVSDQSVSKHVRVGQEFVWECTLTSLAEQKLKVTLRIHFLKANGKHSAKVFAVKDADFGKGDAVRISKRQSFKPITTRAMYPGKHYAELVVNGIARKKLSFELLV